MNGQYPSTLLEKAVNEFAKLPGIGRKTAMRLVLHLLRQDTAAVEALGGTAYWCAGRDEAARLLDSLLQPHDIVLLKGSHSMQVDSLLELVFKNKQL